MALRVIAGSGVGNGSNGRNGADGNGAPGSGTFLGHLRDLAGQTVTVATTCGMVRGELTRVFEDYIMIRHNGTEQHIRLKQICFVATSRNGE